MWWLEAFALTDHQIAHVYLNQHGDKFKSLVRAELEKLDGVAKVICGEDRSEYGLNHHRAGDFVVLAEEDAWFAYYHWFDDSLAPDFARCVDVHRKYGYDPAELFIDPNLSCASSGLRESYLKRNSDFGFLWI